MKINVKCPPCIVCRESSRIEVEETDFYAWQDDTLIQVAFPYLSADEREVLKTGTHGKCWDSFMKDVEDEANGEGQRV